ncbi:hypothetical protein [Kosakonia cowanii]|uniref:hypothetical protein n=1 Tax=Kosakonia cowanii TaxID=208223 RepID=UPI0028A115B3|nr:hypothetical protein [Kosakonia cowanii]
MKTLLRQGFLFSARCGLRAGWRLRLIRPTGWHDAEPGMLHDSTLGAGFVGQISEAPSGNGMLHDSTLGAGFVGLISEAPSGNRAVAELVNIKEG